MISHINGILIKKTQSLVTIDVGGIGYAVRVSSETLSSLPTENEAVSLWTHLAVRENAMDLYGFVTPEELHFFELLIGIPGIGPKSGLAILSLASVDVLKKSITSGNTTYLTKVSGIGKKSAQKIVLELKDKLGAYENTGTDLEEEADVIEALASLGYSLKEAREALKHVPDDVVGTTNRVRAVLQLLGK